MDYCKFSGKTFIMTRSCEFSKQLDMGVKHMATPIMHNILEPTETEDNLLWGVKNNLYFGFILADVEPSTEAIKRFAKINYPPIFKRMEIKYNNLSPFNQAIAKNENFKRTTIIQTFAAKQIFLFTPMAKFYMDNGFHLSNVTKFLQYECGKPLAPYCKKIYDLRVAATKSNDDVLAQTAKLMGNSGK